MIKKINRLLINLYNRTSDFLGEIRARFWGLFTTHMGKHVRIMSGCLFLSPNNIKIGDYTFINRNTIIASHGGKVEIGNYVMIATNCNIVTGNHGFDDINTPMFIQEIVGGPISIGEDVWIGANVVILPNVKIGRGSIIGANAVVTKDVEPYSIVGGVPAKFIKYRFRGKDIAKAEGTKWNNCIFDRNNHKVTRI